MVKEVIILGKAQGWEDAPFHYGEEEVQTWGLNNHVLARPFDILFEPHDVEWWMEHGNEVTWWHKMDRSYKRHIDEVNRLEIPYYTIKKYDFIPSSVEYPVDAICDSFGIDYFTGGIDYILAFAIYQGVGKIDIYGVHTAGDDEYDYQKPCLEFWIGVAVGRGIKIKVHGSISLLKPMYQGKIYTNDSQNADGLRYGYFCNPKEYYVS